MAGGGVSNRQLDMAEGLLSGKVAMLGSNKRPNHVSDEERSKMVKKSIDKVRYQVLDRVRYQVCHQVWHQVWYQVWGQVWHRVGDQVMDQGWDDLRW